MFVLEESFSITAHRFHKRQTVSGGLEAEEIGHTFPHQREFYSVLVYLRKSCNVSVVNAELFFPPDFWH
jgi:hypothetical protein